MASFKVERILIASALVCCALTSTVSSEENESNQLENKHSVSKALMSMLKDQNLKSKQLDDMLRAPEYKDVKINDIKIGELTELCNESLDNCSLDKFKLVSSLTIVYKSTIPQLYRYGQYCRHEKLKEYCLDNYEKVAKILIRNMNSKHGNILEKFKRLLTKSNIVDTAHELDMALQSEANKISEKTTMNRADSITAELDLDEETAEDRARIRDPAFKMGKKYLAKIDSINRKISELYSDLSSEEFTLKQQELYLSEVMDTLKIYGELYSYFRELGDENEKGFKISNLAHFNHFKYARIAHRFYWKVSKEILSKLQVKIAKEYKSDKYEMNWDQFRALTRKQIIEIQRKRSTDNSS